MSSMIVFVYNANGGFVNGIMDSVHKLLRPSTYPCSLCELTHGFFSEKKSWKDYTNHLLAKGYILKGLHKDEVDEFHPILSELPAVVIFDSTKYTLLLSSQELEKIATTADLIKQLELKLSAFNTLMRNSQV